MPTKSNNTGGRGGARPGAGRKKASVRKPDPLDIPEVEGVDMPQPHDFLSAQQRDGSTLQADEIYRETWEWLDKLGCAAKVSTQLLERYAMCSARWIQCEEMTSRMGFLSKHPTTQKPIPSPFINIGINYMNQAVRLWAEITQIAKEHGGADCGDTSPQDDLMERLLRARISDMAKTTTEMQLVPIDRLVPYVNNARTHSPEQIAKLRSSLREFGFVSPVIIDPNFNILVGHGRIAAAKLEGITEVPCVFVDHLTEAQKKAYILADNRMALDAGWDEELLRVEIEALQGADFDIGLTGFDEKELADLFSGDGDDAHEDDFDVDAELEKPCVTRDGDLWLLGRKHRVICGDSTKPETYTRLLGDTKVSLVCTDPPYFVGLESTSGKIKNDDLDDEQGYAFLKSAFECCREAMAKDASIYVFYATSKARVFHDAYEDAGFKVGAGLVWKKDRLVLTRTDWKYIHEPIIWGWRKDGKHIWRGDQKQKTVFEFDRIRNSKEDGCGHPSSKPVPLIAYLIKQCTLTNDLVLDGFLGSASTLIACEQLGRTCYGIELEPKFVDVAVQRYIAQVGSADGVSVIRDGRTYQYSEVCNDTE